MRSAEKEKKKILGRIPLILNPGKKISKKIAKKFKKLLSGIIFSQNGMWQAEKERENRKIKKSLSAIIFSQNVMR